nr:hypothetical protein [Bacteroidota bacterium]
MLDRRKTHYSSTCKKLAVQCQADSFVVAESFVLLINICGEKPAHRKSAKPLQASVATLPTFNIST